MNNQDSNHDPARTRVKRTLGARWAAFVLAGVLAAGAAAPMPAAAQAACETTITTVSDTGQSMDGDDCITVAAEAAIDVIWVPAIEVTGADNRLIVAAGGRLGIDGDRNYDATAAISNSSTGGPRNSYVIHGDITVAGDGNYGFESLGGGSGNSFTLESGGTISVSGNRGAAIRESSGGNSYFINGTVTVTGADSRGILASSVRSASTFTMAGTLALDLAAAAPRSFAIHATDGSHIFNVGGMIDLSRPAMDYAIYNEKGDSSYNIRQGAEINGRITRAGGNPRLTFENTATNFSYLLEGYWRGSTGSDNIRHTEGEGYYSVIQESGADSTNGAGFTLDGDDYLVVRPPGSIMTTLALTDAVSASGDNNRVIIGNTVSATGRSIIFSTRSRAVHLASGAGNHVVIEDGVTVTGLINNAAVDSRGNAVPATLEIRHTDDYLLDVAGAWQDADGNSLRAEVAAGQGSLAALFDGSTATNGGMVMDGSDSLIVKPVTSGAAIATTDAHAIAPAGDGNWVLAEGGLSARGDNVHAIYNASGSGNEYIVQGDISASGTGSYAIYNQGGVGNIYTIADGVTVTGTIKTDAPATLLLGANIAVTSLSLEGEWRDGRGLSLTQSQGDSLDIVVSTAVMGGYRLDGKDSLTVTETGSIATTEDGDHGVQGKGQDNEYVVTGDIATEGPNAHAIHNRADGNNSYMVIGSAKTFGDNAHAVYNEDGGGNNYAISGHVAASGLASHVIHNGGGGDNRYTISGTVSASGMASHAIYNQDGGGNRYAISGTVSASPTAAGNAYAIYNQAGTLNTYDIAAEAVMTGVLKTDVRAILLLAEGFNDNRIALEGEWLDGNGERVVLVPRVVAIEMGTDNPSDRYATVGDTVTVTVITNRPDTVAVATVSNPATAAAPRLTVAIGGSTVEVAQTLPATGAAGKVNVFEFTVTEATPEGPVTASYRGFDALTELSRVTVDHTVPSAIGTLTTSNDDGRSVAAGDTVTMTVAAAGDVRAEAVLAGSPQALARSPVRVGAIRHDDRDDAMDGNSGAALSDPRAVFVRGDYAYLAANGSDALEIVDVSDPANPRHVSAIYHDDPNDPMDGDSRALLNNPVAVFVSGNYAYVVSWFADSLEIVDISDPAKPVHAGAISGDAGGAALAGAFAVFVRGGYAYVASQLSNALEIVDVSDPTQPMHAGAIYHDYSNDAVEANRGVVLFKPSSVFVRGNYAYVTSRDSDALQIVDVSDPTQPTPAGVIFHDDPEDDTDGNSDAVLDSPLSVFVRGDYAYVASQFSSSLEIVDVSDPANPSHAGVIRDGGEVALAGASSVFVRGGYAYLTAQFANALQVVDVSDPRRPVHAGAIRGGDGDALLNYPRSVFVRGGYAYVATGESDALEILSLGSVLQGTVTATAAHETSAVATLPVRRVAVDAAGNTAVAAAGAGSHAIHNPGDDVYVISGSATTTGDNAHVVYHESGAGNRYVISGRVTAVGMASHAIYNQAGDGNEYIISGTVSASTVATDNAYAIYNQSGANTYTITATAMITGTVKTDVRATLLLPADFDDSGITLAGEWVDANGETAAVNRAPVIAGTLPLPLAAPTAGVPWTYAPDLKGVFTDPDGDSLTVAFADLPDWLTAVTDPATGAVSVTGTPPATSGTTQITLAVTADDGRGRPAVRAERVVTILVPPPPRVGRPPTLENPIAGRLAAPGQQDFAVPLAGVFADPDGDDLTITVALADGAAWPEWLELDRESAAAPRLFAVTVGAADSYVIRVTATDEEGLTTFMDFTLTVAMPAAAPAAPTAVDDSFSFTRGEPLVGNVLANDSDANHDSLAVASFWVPGDTASRVAAGGVLTLPALGELTLEADGVLSLVLNPAAHALGADESATAMVAYLASDGTGAGMDGSDMLDETAPSVGRLTLTVRGSAVTTNAAPARVWPLPSLTAYAGLPFRYAVPDNAFRDGDLEPLRYAVTMTGGGVRPAWLDFDAKAGVLSGVPTAEHVSATPVSLDLRASDAAGAAVTTTFRLTVVEAPAAPGTLTVADDMASLQLPYVAISPGAPGDVSPCLALTLTAPMANLSAWEFDAGESARDCDLPAGTAHLPLLDAAPALDVPLAMFAPASGAMTCLTMQFRYADMFILTAMAAVACPAP